MPCFSALLSDDKLGLKLGEQQALRNTILERSAERAAEDGGSAAPGASQGGHESGGGKALPRDLMATDSRDLGNVDFAEATGGQGLVNAWQIENFSDIEYDAQAGYLPKGVTGSVYKAQWHGMRFSVQL